MKKSEFLKLAHLDDKDLAAVKQNGDALMLRNKLLKYV